MPNDSVERIPRRIRMRSTHSTSQRGRPEALIGYADEAARLAPEQLGEFEAASFRFTKPR